MRHLRWDFFFILFLTASPVMAAEVFVPQVIAGQDTAAGLDFVTRFHLVNLSGAAVMVELQAVLNSGSPMMILPGSGPFGNAGDSATLVLPARGATTVESALPAGAQVGWARIQTDGSVGVVVTLAAYASGGAREILTSTSLMPGELARQFTAYALVGSRARTGIALLNPSSTETAHVTLRLIDGSGAQIRETTRTFPPLGKIAQFLDDPGLFGAMQWVEGSLEAVSTIPISATVIRVDDIYWSAFGTFSARPPHGGGEPAEIPNVIDVDFASFPSDPETYAGPEIFVSNSGSDTSGDGSSQNPYRTISHAISGAADGSVVTVRGGLYSEGPSDEYRALVIETDNLVVRAMPGETVTVQPMSQDITYGAEISGSNIVLDGINLTGFSSAGISIANESQTVSNLVLKNLSVSLTEPSDGIVSYSDFTGRSVPAVDGLLLKNVTVNGAGLGISCNAGPCNNWRLENVVVKNAGLGGGSGADAIAIESGDNFLFLGGEVTGADGDGIDVKGDRALVYNAHVHHVGRNGVKLWQRGEIVNCLVHHTGADAGIVLDQGSRVRILNSVVAYHNYGMGSSYSLTAGYDVPGQPMEIDLINTVFFNNSGGLFFSPGSVVNVQNCLFSGAENGMVMEVSSRTGGGRLQIRATDTVAIFETHGIGSGNLAFDVDPGFVNPAAGDFGFGPTSPLVDEGTVPQFFPDFDRLFRARIQGTAPDLGPDELH